MFYFMSKEVLLFSVRELVWPGFYWFDLNGDLKIIIPILQLWIFFVNKIQLQQEPESNVLNNRGKL